MTWLTGLGLYNTEVFGEIGALKALTGLKYLYLSDTNVSGGEQSPTDSVLNVLLCVSRPRVCLVLQSECLYLLL